MTPLSLSQLDNKILLLDKRYLSGLLGENDSKLEIIWCVRFPEAIRVRGIFTKELISSVFTS